MGAKYGTIDTRDRAKISVGAASLGGNEGRYVMDAMQRGWLTMGHWVNQFEMRFAAALGVKYAVAVNSGTAALHLALLALGIGPGDEVIVPSLTFVASANAILYTGARPVFVDVEPVSWGLDPEQVERAITPHTKAILAVHLYGAPVHPDIYRIAGVHNLRVVEDAAEALGARMHGRWCGGLGDVGCFSFYGNKTVTTGEGGMVSTDNAAIAERVRRLRGQGQVPGRSYWHDRVGYNYRMTDMQGAVGCAQMERLGTLLYCRQVVAELYRANLSQVIRFQQTFTGCEHGNWMAAGVICGGERDQVMDELATRGIESRPVFPPVHTMPMYRLSAELPVTGSLARRGIVLPTHAELTPEDVLYVCETLKEILHGEKNTACD